MTRSRIAVRLLLALLLTALVAGAATAQQPSPAETPEVQIPEGLKSSSYELSAAMSRVFIDGATGALRQPTRAELRSIAEAAQRVAAARPMGVRKAATFELPSGGVGAEVPPELMSYSMVRLDDDGGKHAQCAVGADSAAPSMLAPVSSATPEDR